MVIVEGFLLSYDAALTRMFGTSFWIDADCGTGLQRRYRRDGPLGSINGGLFEQFSAHIRGLVRKDHEVYKGQQLANAPSAFHLDGAAPAECLVTSGC